MAGSGREPIAARPRMAPLWSLVNAATIVPDDPSELPPEAQGALAALPFGAKWLHGVRYRRELCGVAQGLYSGCKIPGFDNFTGDFHRDSVEVDVDPFRVFTGDTCSSFGWSVNDYVGRAQRELAASEAYAVEHEFWTGTQAKAAISAGIAYPDDQWLAQTVTAVDVTPSPGTSITISKGLALLQQALGDCSGGGPGMVHTPPTILNPLLTAQLVTPINSNGIGLTTIVDGRGNKVVPGFGYSANTGPTAAPAAAGKAWMYATGPVYIKRGDPVVTPSTMAQALNRSTNDLTFHVERDYLVDWDRCCHFAVLVSNPD